MSDDDLVDADLVALWRQISVGVLRTNQRIAALVEQAGVPESWFEVLDLLSRAPDNRLPMSRLAREVMMSSGGFTKLADRMAREGLIDRRGSSADRRVVYAAMTDAGRRIAEAGSAAYRDAIRSVVLAGVSDADLADLAGRLGVLADQGGPAEGVEVDGAADEDGDAVLRARDPALPDRRGRGHTSN